MGTGLSSPLSTCKLPASHLVTVTATGDRGGKKAYIVQISEKTARDLGLKRWATLAFEHPVFSFHAKLKLSEPKFLAIHCQVQVRDGIPDGIAAVDQTLRNALGVPVRSFKDLTGLRFFLLPARRSRWNRVRTRVSSLFGTRYLAFRASVSAVSDIEKGYVRVPCDTLITLGLSEGDDLIVERPFAVVGPDGYVHRFEIADKKFSTFGASDRMLDERDRLEAEFEERYPVARPVLYHYDYFVRAGYWKDTQKPELKDQSLSEPDVPPIFMDQDARSFGVKKFSGNNPAYYLTPLIVRRSIRSVISRESLQTGATFGIALIGVVMTSSAATGPRLFFGVVGAGAITAILLILRLRQQV